MKVRKPQFQNIMEMISTKKKEVNKMQKPLFKVSSKFAARAARLGLVHNDGSKAYLVGMVMQMDKSQEEPIIVKDRHRPCGHNIRFQRILNSK